MAFIYPQITPVTPITQIPSSTIRWSDRV